MKRVTLSIIIAALGLATTLNALVYKGQKEYMKQCRVCHSGGEQIAQKETQKTWQAYFAKKGKKLSDIHIGSQRVEDQINSLHQKGQAKKVTKEGVEKYFKSKKYVKTSRHLRDFFVEYAKDSGNVPACN